MKKSLLNKLKKNLPRHYPAKLAKITGYSENLVSQVLNGGKKNLTIIEAAIQLVKDEKKRIEDLENEINQLEEPAAEVIS